MKEFGKILNPLEIILSSVKIFVKTWQNTKFLKKSLFYVEYQLYENIFHTQPGLNNVTKETQGI